MRLYAAFDLHSSNSYLGIVEENGKRTFKRRLRNEPEMIRETLRPFKADIVGITVESTYNWYWLVDFLMEEGYRVHLGIRGIRGTLPRLSIKAVLNDCFFFDNGEVYQIERIFCGSFPCIEYLDRNNPSIPGIIDDHAIQLDGLSYGFIRQEFDIQKIMCGIVFYPHSFDSFQYRLTCDVGFKTASSAHSFLMPLFFNFLSAMGMISIVFISAIIRKWSLFFK